ncbi:MAG: hypothetical protein P4L51_02595 [Puia sp.]|nr:hypothetical protein [Puia sp.]
MFNYKEQEQRLRRYLLICLGDFRFSGYPATAYTGNSCLYSFRDPISDFDTKVIRLQYSAIAKPGMKESEFHDALKSTNQLIYAGKWCQKKRVGR